jgi:hypothetical protein
MTSEKLSKLFQVVLLLTCVEEMPGMGLRWDANYAVCCGFLEFIQAKALTVQEHILSSSLSFRQYMLYSVD